jgi:hypothetical protein
VDVDDVVVVVDAAAFVVFDVRSRHHGVESGSFFELTASLHSEPTWISEMKNLDFDYYNDWTFKATIKQLKCTLL